MYDMPRLRHQFSKNSGGGWGGGGGGGTSVSYSIKVRNEDIPIVRY